MDVTRRDFVGSAVAVIAAGAAIMKPAPAYADAKAKPPWDRPPLEPAVAGRDYRPVVTPNGATLPFKVVDGVKVFHLIAEEVLHEFAPGLKAKCWGFNGRVHGPTIEAVEGDRVRIYVTNSLNSATAIHWHAVLVPNGMDGVGGLTQKVIEPGQTFKYEFTLPTAGTFMYHSHHNEMVQVAFGLMGMFVVHPRQREAKPADRDYAILLSEWKIIAGATRPDPNEMSDFNVFTFNARAFPGTAPLVAKLGERVRIRIGNLSPTDHHPIHIHGHAFKVVATDGGPVPESAQWPETTVLVAVGSTRTIEFIADNPGDWLMHCHMTHHMMNQMGHGLPNLIGVDTAELDKKIGQLIPGYMTMTGEEMAGMSDMPMPPNSISMMPARGPFGDLTTGGMATIVKVREELEEGKDPGWYKHPEHASNKPATPDELKRDGISPPERKPIHGEHKH